MGATFYKSATVEPGDAITSTQWNSLAAAINSRLESGLGDCTWRIWWKVISLMRTIRAPQDTLTPAIDEFWRSYIFSGEGEGVFTPGNFAHPLQVLTSGNEDAGVEPEDVMLNNIPASRPETMRGRWDLAKSQRPEINRLREYLKALFPISSLQRAPNSENPILMTWGGPQMRPYNNVLSFKGINGADDIEIDIDGDFLDLEFYYDFYLITYLEHPPRYIPHSHYCLRNMGAVFPNRSNSCVLQSLFAEFAARFKGADVDREGEFDITKMAPDFQFIFERQSRFSYAGSYPVASYVGPIAAGAALPSHVCASGYCLAGFITEAVGLDSSVVVTIGSERFTVKNGEQIHWFENAPTSATPTVESEIPSGAIIGIEFAELEQRNGDALDAYVMIRRGSTKGIVPDHTGPEFKDGPSLVNNYRTGGLIWGDIPNPTLAEGAVADLPLYETTRRMLKENLLLLGRESFISYAEAGGVDGYGAELVFARRNPQGLDMWGGFGAITATPSEQGETNEWLMFIGTNGYNTSGAFKPDGYADVVGPLIGRAHLFSVELTPNSEGARGAIGNMSEGGVSMVSPRIPSAFNYFDQSNANASDEWHAANPVYPQDYDVHSVVIGADTVTVRLKGPLRGAGVTGYRTDSNALTDYMAYVGGVAAPVREGDTASTDDGHVFRGNCFPRFYFTRKIRGVYQDLDDEQNKHDTKALSERLRWCYFILDAICEGFVDPQSTGGGCLRPAHLTYQVLSYLAIGRTHPPLLVDRDRPGLSQGWGPFPNTVFLAEQFNHVALMVNQLTLVPLELPAEIEIRRGEGIAKLPLLGQTADPIPVTGSWGGSALGTIPAIDAGGVDSWSDWRTEAITVGAYVAPHVYLDPAFPNFPIWIVDNDAGVINCANNYVKLQIRAKRPIETLPSFPPQLVGIVGSSDIYCTRVDNYSYYEFEPDAPIILNNGTVSQAGVYWTLGDVRARLIETEETTCVRIGADLNYELNPKTPKAAAGWLHHSGRHYGGYSSISRSSSALYPNMVLVATIPTQNLTTTQQ